MKVLVTFIVTLIIVTNVHAQCSAYAGLDFSICGNTAVLNGSVSGSPGASVTWSSPVAGVSFSNPGAAVTTVVFAPQVAQGTPIPLVLTEYIALPSCVSTDTVFVMRFLQEQATHLVDPADSINCGRVCDLLAAQQPAYGNGYWYDSVNLTQFYPNNFSHNPDSVIIAPSAYGPHYFYWVTVNGTCRDTSDAIPVNFYQQPVANAGSNYWPGLFGPDSEIKTDTACGLCYKLSAYPTGFPGMWFTTDPANVHFTGTGVNSDTVCINDYTVYTPPGYTELIWMTDNHGCVDKDTLRMYFAPRPSGNFTATMPDCRYGCSTLLAYTWPMPGNIDYGLTTFYWDFGGGILCTPLDILHSDTIFVHWTSDTSHLVTLITQSQWGCRSTLSQRIVYEPPLFNPGYAINPASCGNCNGEIILSTENNSFYFEWLDPTIVSVFDTMQYGLCSGSNYPVKVSGLSLSPDAYPGTICHDTISITMTTLSPPVADFDIGNHSDIVFPYILSILNESQNASRYKWIVSDDNGNILFTSSNEDLTFLLDTPGCFNIMLIAKQIPDSSWFGITRPGCYDTLQYSNLCLLPVHSSVLAYPNPMNDFADLYIADLSSSNNVVNYRIVNTTGNTMAYGHYDIPVNNTMRVSRGNLIPGLYYLEIFAGKVYRTKLVVE